VTAEALLPDPNARPGRVLAIARKAQENSEEKGLETLYLARHLLCPCLSAAKQPRRAPSLKPPHLMVAIGQDWL
jgi:hypothetical protein